METVIFRIGRNVTGRGREASTWPESLRDCYSTISLLLLLFSSFIFLVPYHARYYTRVICNMACDTKSDTLRFWRTKEKKKGKREKGRNTILLLPIPGLIGELFYPFFAVPCTYSFYTIIHVWWNYARLGLGLIARWMSSWTSFAMLKERKRKVRWGWKLGCNDISEFLNSEF